MKPTRKTFAAEAAALDGDLAEITITTPSIDLMGDSIDPTGMETATYLAGPAPVFVSHDYRSLPVGRTVALDKSRRGIRATFRWIEGDQQAAIVRNVFEQGALGASVGITVLDAEPNSEGGYSITKSRLTEFSLTGHPANPECVRMYKALRRAAGPSNCPNDKDCPAKPETAVENCPGYPKGICPLRGENASVRAGG